MLQSYGFYLKTARQTAGFTQEQTAELSAVSIETWRAYEYDDRMPPQSVAVRICNALNAPWLALEWLKCSTADLGVIPDGIPTQELPTAVLMLINRVFAFADNHRDRQLMEIAEDGVIDDTEQEVFDAIVRDLDGIIGAALAVKYPKGHKKTAPTRTRQGGRCSDLSVENDCRKYYSTSGRKVQAPPCIERG